MTTITPVNLNPSTVNYSQVFVAGINNSGQVVGYASGFGSFLWQNGSASSIGSDNFFAGAINNSGVVAGSDGYVDFGSNPPNTILDYGFIATVQNGTQTKIGALGDGLGQNMQVNAINSSGEIVGESASDAGYSTAGFLYQDGKVMDIGHLPGGTITYANGIDDAGEVVGTSFVPLSSTSNIVDGEAYVWQNGVMTRLASLPGSISDDAKALNNSGLIVGQSGQDAVMWKNGAVISLAAQSGYVASIAEAINDEGVIVGSETSPYDSGKFPPTFSHAVVWDKGAIYDLNALLPANSGWVLSEATGINDQNEIVGTGTYNGKAAGFLLTLDDGTSSFTAAAALQASSSGLFIGSVAVSDTSLEIASVFDQLQAVAATGRLSSIAFTDPGVATLVISSAQANADAAALAAVTGNFWLIQETDINAGNQTITGSAGALGNSVVFNGIASLYSVKPAGDGVHFTVLGYGASYQLSGIQALKFIDIDYNEIVAPEPGSNGVVTGGNVTELYGAVFGRIPDVPGLGYYEKELAADPSLSLVTLAKDFLTSPEYTNAHNYAQSAAGEAQFITDSYHNLLKRTPESGAIPYYQEIIASFTQGLTPGTAAYAAAELDAHAVVLVDFSASAEFLGDVQITAAHPASAGFTGHWLVLI